MARSIHGFFGNLGVMITVPELWGSLFIGRTKEGVSLSKVMSGYAVEMLERHMASDPIPILADGIKWLGYLPTTNVFLEPRYILRLVIQRTIIFNRQLAICIRGSDGCRYVLKQSEYQFTHCR